MVAAADLTFDLKQLPIRAMLAYAARCARRAQPHFKLSANHPDAVACRKAVESAIRLAEAFVAGGEIDPQVVAQIEEVVMRALMSVSADGGSEKSAAYAANAAYAVISATAAALEAEFADDPTDIANRVLEACVIATESATAADDDIERAARLDWEMLHRMRLGKFPELGEPINPSETGILGPLYCLKSRSHRSHRPEKTVRVRDGAESEHTATDSGATQAGDNARQGTTPGPRNGSENSVAQFAASHETSERLAQKAKALAARLRVRREKFAQDRLVLQAERVSFEVERQTFVSERTAFDERQNRNDEVQQPGREAELQGRREELAAWEAALEQRQRDVEAMARQLDKRSLELAAVQERLDEGRVALECERKDIESRDLARRDQDRLLDEHQRQLAQESSRVSAASDKIKRVLERLVKRRRQSAAERLELRTEHDLLLVEIERHQELLGRHQQDVELLAGQEQVRERERQDLETARSELLAEKARLDSDQASLEEVHAQLSAERDRLEGVKQDLESERQRLQSGRAQLQDERELLAMQHADLDAEKLRLESGREELKRQQEACEAEHIALLEEKEEVARRDSEPAQSLPEGGANDAGKPNSPSESPHESSVASPLHKSQDELKVLLEQLRQERSELHAERLHLSDLISQLNGVRPQRRDSALDDASATFSDANDADDVYTLTFLLELGSAKAGQLAEMFALLSNLYQVLGGDGLVFEVRECRIWSYGESRTPSKRKATTERAFAEVLARADRSRTPDPDPGLWEKFTSTLVTTVRFDTRLTDYFNLGELIGEDHRRAAPAYKAIADVSAGGYSDMTQKSGKWSLSIDAITLLRKRIESLRGKLERESQMTLELVGAGAGVNLIRHRQTTPAPKTAAQEPARKEPAKGGRRGRKLLALGSLIAVLAVILGICVL